MSPGSEHSYVNPVRPKPRGVRALLIVVYLLVAAPALAATDSGIEWQPWNDASFEQAKAENKPLYLYLQAVWCHWCHVMEDKTFTDPGVVKTLNQDFIAIKVDHDARPALANRYRAWGWPAQIWFSPQGQEIRKRAGYINPQDFRELLAAIKAKPNTEFTSNDEPDTGPPADGDGLTLALRERLQAKHRDAYDPENAGLAIKRKFLDPDSVEYALRRAAQGDEQAARRARSTLDKALMLIDPVWGGAYQYSTHGDWSHPHYEKIMRTQAAYLRIYALAYMQTGDPDYRTGAQSIAAYLRKFWRSPQGGFYTSQDADLIQGEKAHDYFALDDAARRERGLPRIDKNRYAQENGQAIEGLALLYQATGDGAMLTLAEQAARWVVANRSLEDGGFSHAAEDNGGPYLGDNLAMARAFLELYRATADREWLQKSQAAARFIGKHLRREAGGFYGASAAAGPLEPIPNVDENIGATRYFNLLAHYTGDAADRELANHGMRYLAMPAVATRRIDESGILLADTELRTAPLHITVVGGHGSQSADEMYAAALRTPGWYKRTEWWDRSAGPLPNPDVEYPDLGRPAGFLCESQRCSVPQFSAEKLRALIAERSEAES